MTTKPVRVIAGDTFIRELKRLSKKYPHIEADVKPLTDQLQAGETPGDQIAGVGYMVYKVRLANRDLQRGKRGGYRVVYYLHTADSIFLVTIYSKTEQEDVPLNLIQRLIEALETNQDQGDDLPPLTSS